MSYLIGEDTATSRHITGEMMLKPYIGAEARLPSSSSSPPPASSHPAMMHQQHVLQHPAVATTTSTPLSNQHPAAPHHITTGPTPQGTCEPVRLMSPAQLVQLLSINRHHTVGQEEEIQKREKRSQGVYHPASPKNSGQARPKFKSESSSTSTSTAKKGRSSASRHNNNNDNGVVAGKTKTVKSHTGGSKSTNVCKHWCHFGKCKHGNQCFNKHEMPTDTKGLSDVGLQETPGWWRTHEELQAQAVKELQTLMDRMKAGVRAFGLDPDVVLAAGEGALASSSSPSRKTSKAQSAQTSSAPMSYPGVPYHMLPGMQGFPFAVQTQGGMPVTVYMDTPTSGMRGIPGMPYSPGFPDLGPFPVQQQQAQSQGVQSQLHDGAQEGTCSEGSETEVESPALPPHKAMAISAGGSIKPSKTTPTTTGVSKGSGSMRLKGNAQPHIRKHHHTQPAPTNRAPSSARAGGTGTGTGTYRGGPSTTHKAIPIPASGAVYAAARAQNQAGAGNPSPGPAQQQPMTSPNAHHYDGHGDGAGDNFYREVEAAKLKAEREHEEKLAKEAVMKRHQGMLDQQAAMRQQNEKLPHDTTMQAFHAMAIKDESPKEESEVNEIPNSIGNNNANGIHQSLLDL
ncbi:hypothetical protein F5Y17DRAFT_75273 [Xylariaceae sp. FL0594]|nr:hypothetical protein F5Y17DRAFT_75273 [Xylariaceae sp. FL0594]